MRKLSRSEKTSRKVATTVGKKVLKPRKSAARPRHSPSKDAGRGTTSATPIRVRLGLIWCILRHVPVSLHIAVLLALAVSITFTVNTVHWILRKPTELLAPISQVMVKSPEETWRAYGARFQQYSTETVSPSLLAALAQVESSGNPAAHTYWRWNLKASDWFGLYRPASSSIGMYQMTDPAFQDARSYCIRNHKVVAEISLDKCSHDPVLARISPAESIELTAIYLDRKIVAALEEEGGPKPSATKLLTLGAIIHLCGLGPAENFIARGFTLEPEERCGDHDPADYLAQVLAFAKQFDAVERRFEH